MSTAVYPPTQPSIFGRIISGGEVEAWCIALVQRWISTYLAESERQAGLTAGEIQRPRAYVIAPSLDKLPEDQLPAIVLVSIGLAERPLKTGGGVFRARWDMGLACVVSARRQSESHDLAQRYMAALRALFIQRPSLDGHAEGVDWQGERYDELDYDDVRTLSAGIAAFTVEVDDITSANAGPVTPDEPLDDETAPWGDWPVVQTADVDVEKVDAIQQEGGTPQ